MRTHRRRA